jgi:hypothetical protein
LILVLAIAAAAGLALPLRRLTRRRAVGTAEAAFPQLLTTHLSKLTLIGYLSQRDWDPVGARARAAIAF